MEPLSVLNKLEERGLPALNQQRVLSKVQVICYSNPEHNLGPDSAIFCCGVRDLLPQCKCASAATGHVWGPEDARMALVRRVMGHGNVWLQ